MQVVQWLLANNYLMTALELLVEAQEVGRDDEVEELQVFFSNREKFPPEEVAKFDQKDGEHQPAAMCRVCKCELSKVCSLDELLYIDHHIVVHDWHDCAFVLSP